MAKFAGIPCGVCARWRETCTHGLAVYAAELAAEPAPPAPARALTRHEIQRRARAQGRRTAPGPAATAAAPAAAAPAVPLDERVPSPLLPALEEAPLPDDDAPLERRTYAGMAGLRSSHLAGLSAIGGGEIATACQVAGVLTADGLRSPASWVLVSGARATPHAEPRWPSGGGTLTVSPSGYAVYSSLQAPPGTALLWTFSEADAARRLASPEVVLTSWDGVLPMPAITAVVGKTVAVAHAHWWAYVSACPTLHPYEAPADCVDERGETVVAATCVGLLAWRYVLEGRADLAELCLRSVPGPVEWVARRRLRASGVEVPRGVFLRPIVDGPWRHGAAATTVPAWAAQAAALLRAYLCWTPEVQISATWPHDVHALERCARADWDGPAVVFSMEHFQPHAFGGASTADGAVYAYRRASGAPLAVLPRTDGVTHRGGCIALPAREGRGGDAEGRDAVRWILSAMAAGAFRRARRQEVEPGANAHGPAVLAPRDVWFADASWTPPSPGPDPRRRGGRQAPAPGAGPRYGEAWPPAPPARPAPAPLPTYVPREDVVAYVNAVVEVGPPPPEAWEFLRMDYVGRSRHGRVTEDQTVPHDVPVPIPAASPPGNPPAAHARPPPGARVAPTPALDPAADGRVEGQHLFGWADVGFPRVRSVRRPLPPGETPDREPVAPPRLTEGVVRVGVLATVYDVGFSAGAAWSEREPSNLFGTVDEFHAVGRGRSAFGAAWSPLAGAIPEGSRSTSNVASRLSPGPPTAYSRVEPGGGRVRIPASSFDDLVAVAAELAVNPLARGVGAWFGAGGQVWVAGRCGERTFAQFRGDLRSNAETLLAVMATAGVRGGAAAAAMWHAVTWPMLSGGRAARKRLAGEAHLAMIHGRSWREIGSPGILVEIQRWLGRGLFCGSPSLDTMSPRMQAEPPTYLGHGVSPKAADWIVAAAKDTLSNLGPGRCVECREHGKALWWQYELFCADCGAARLSPFGRGGGTPSFTRAAGGGHAALAVAARGYGLDYGRGDHDEVAVALQSAILCDRSLPAFAVWTQVYPSGQVGARLQETPSTAVAAAAPVLSAVFGALVDLNWVVTRLRPAEASSALRGTPNVPLLAYDATAASDGGQHDVLRRLAALGPPVRGLADWRDLVGDLAFHEDDVVDLRPVAIERYLSYESVSMTPAEWSRRAVRDDERSHFPRPLATNVDPLAVVIAGEAAVLDGRIWLVTGPTGCGKTRAVMELDTQAAVAISLPTRASIVAAAEDAFRETARPTGVVFFEAGRIADPAAPAALGGAVFDEGGWRAVRRPEALREKRALVTPYQLQRRVDLRATVAVVDEAHELDWERMKAIAVAASTGARLVLVSATPPSFATRPLADVAGRPFATIELAGPSLRATVSPMPGAREGPGLFVFASLADCLAGAARHNAVALHGLLTPTELSDALARAADGETVAATVGVVRSAITLGPVAWVVLDPKLRTVRRYQLGSGLEYRTAWTDGELAQIVGRAARLPPYVGHAEVPWARWQGQGTSWVAALANSGVVCASPVEAAREADFLAQLEALGTPMDDGIAALTCELMGATVAVVPFLRACNAAVEEWLGGPLRAVVDGLSPDDRAEWDLGLDPGTVAAAVTLGTAGQAIRTPARRWDRHRALPGAAEVPPSLWFSRALALRLGPGAAGMFGIASGLNPSDERYAELLGPARESPAPGLVGVPSLTFYDGRVQPQDTVPRVHGLSLAEVEQAALERARAGRKPRINDSGTPMGGAANGPIVNACISQAARAASMLHVCAQVAHGANPPAWALPYRAVPPPQLDYYVPACASSTGGDDELGAGDMVAAVAGGVMRAAVGARTGVIKTASTHCDSGPLGLAALPGGSLEKARELSGREACEAFGGRIPKTSSLRGIAPFLERYFETSPHGLSVVRVRPTVAYARSVAAMLRGEPCEASAWAEVPEVAALTGCTPEVYNYLQEWRPVDARVLLGGSSPPSASGPTAVTVSFTALGRRHATPAAAGRQAGRPPGARLIGRMVQYNLYLRSVRKPPLAFLVVGELGTSPRILVPEHLRRSISHLLIDGRFVPAYRTESDHSRLDLREVPSSLLGAVAAVAVDAAEFSNACAAARIERPEPSMERQFAEEAVLDWFAAADGELELANDAVAEADAPGSDVPPGFDDARTAATSKSTGSWRESPPREPAGAGAAAGAASGTVDAVEFEWYDAD